MALGLGTLLGLWIKYFLTNRTQHVRILHHHSQRLGAPLSCVLSPVLPLLFTQDCTVTHSSNTLFKFADDTTFFGLLTDNKVAYRGEAGMLSLWRKDNKKKKAKKMVIDFRIRRITGTGEEVERVIQGSTFQKISPGA